MTSNDVRILVLFAVAVLAVAAIMAVLMMVKRAKRTTQVTGASIDEGVYPDWLDPNSIGIRTAPDLTTSPSIRISPRTRVDVLEQQGIMVRVQLPDNGDGWVTVDDLDRLTVASEPRR